MTPEPVEGEGVQPIQEVVAAITAAEGDLSRYLELDRTLVGGLRAEEADILDLSRSPGWDVLDPEDRHRVAFLAAGFLTESANVGEHEPPAYPGRMHLRAMVLLQHFPELQATLGQRVWDRFGALSLAEPQSSSAKAERRALLEATFERAPKAVTAALNARLSYAGDEVPALLDLVPAGCWPSLLPAVVEATSTLTDPRPVGEILAELLRRGFRSVLPRIRKMLREGGVNDRVAALLALAGYRPRVGGPLLARCVAADEKIGEAVLYAWLTGQRHGSPMLERLPDRVLGDLYLWLAKGPAAFDDDAGRPRSDFAESIRDGIMRLLVVRGALSDVRRVAGALPEAPVLRVNVGAARNSQRRQRWQAPAPADVLRLVSDRRRRLVASPDELADVVLEVLQELQQDLRGDTPMAYLLWNDVRRKKGGARPTHKDEESLSDFLKWYLTLRLQKRGVILNREVQIRRGGEGWQGERLDLLIEAVSATHDVVAVVVEVKGSWNSEWATGMRDQLVGRYLKENRRRPGIYLVGYFPGSAAAGKLPLDELRRVLDEQAAGFRTSGQRVEAVVLDISLG